MSARKLEYREPESRDGLGKLDGQCSGRDLTQSVTDRGGELEVDGDIVFRACMPVVDCVRYHAIVSEKLVKTLSMEGSGRVQLC